MLDLQKYLDDFYAAHPELHPYVTKLYYIKPDSAVPDGVTHINRLFSHVSPVERSLSVGIAMVPEYALLLDAILALLATAPPGLALPIPTPKK